MRRLTELKEGLEEDASKLTRVAFSWLFPFGPAWNSVLGTFYISSFVLVKLTVLHMLNVRGSVPNMILAFIPAEIRPNTLNTMTAFAVRCTSRDVSYNPNL